MWLLVELWRASLETLFIVTEEQLILFAGKPTKPKITGSLNVIENSEALLTCVSNSTSRPSYYSKAVSFNYTWFINDTVLTSEVGNALTIPRITRDERFNKYSCQTKETIQSDKSDDIQVNVWCEYFTQINVWCEYCMDKKFENYQNSHFYR